MNVAPENGRNRIMIYGPRNDNTYIVEFKTADEEALAINVPVGETRVLAGRWPAWTRKSRAVRRDLARLIRAHYVTEQSASMDTVIYVITDLGRRALDELKDEMGIRANPMLNKSLVADERLALTRLLARRSQRRFSRANLSKIASREQFVLDDDQRSRLLIIPVPPSGLRVAILLLSDVRSANRNIKS
jgi:hypothetical protein